MPAEQPSPLTAMDLGPPRSYLPGKWYVTQEGVTFRVSDDPRRVLMNPEARARKDLHTANVEHPDGSTSRLVWDALTTKPRLPWPLYLFF
jgi:hypothetical protein